MTDEEFKVYQHLVVARASAVNLLAHVAKLARKHELHLRMNILYTVLNDKLAALAHGIDVLQFGQKCLKLVAAKQSDRLEHGDVCH